jgi:uncharacterized protein
MIADLLQPAAYPHPVKRLQLLETHISWVILTGEWAYKLKKPVNFGFVDFSTPTLRHVSCTEELRLNCRLAAEWYVSVVPVYQTAAGATFVPPALDTASQDLRSDVHTVQPIEFAVKMRQFDQSQLLPAVLARGELRPDHGDRLAVHLAQFQRSAGIAGADDPWGEFEAVRHPVMQNFRALGKAAEFSSRLATLQQWAIATADQLAPLFALRKQQGRVRECHGDLHLGNMLLHNDEVVMFDCLEFNAGLRWIDVISEMAFLVMDLAERGRADLANRVLNRWLQETGDYGGLATWTWYFCYRAMVRAKVAGLRRQQPGLSLSDLERLHSDLENYIALAELSIRPRNPALILMHGRSGSGKSFVAQQLAERLNAVVIRSDIERKRLFGLWGDPIVGSHPLVATSQASGHVDTPSPGQSQDVLPIGSHDFAHGKSSDLYSAAAGRQTYGRLLQLAETIVQAGFTVIIDAASLKREQRARVRQRAIDLGLRHGLVACEAPEAVLAERLSHRQATGEDPSDADWAVCQQQAEQAEPILHDEGWPIFTIDTCRFDDVAALTRWAQALSSASL